jgi:SOS-response transcriptional repressor LexA
MDKRQDRDMNKTPVTPAQQRVLDVIRRHLEEHNRTPTIRQICEELGLKSTFSVSTQINRLQKKGHLAEGSRVALSDRYRTVVLEKSE